MKIESVEKFDREALLSALRKTRLRGFGNPLIYESATLELVRAQDTDNFVPAQRYVLRAGVSQIIELREALLPHGIDVFDLNGGVLVRSSDAPDEVIPVIPPIIEESREPDGRVVNIINDGIHRVYAARQLGLPITVVLIKGVPEQYPYYAYALPNGWEQVLALDDLPDNFEKKAYRLPDNYKSLFRDFNAIFPGVQKQRKQSNPMHIRA